MRASDRSARSLKPVLVLLLTGVDVVAAVLQHSVNQASQFMGRRNEALWFAESRTHAAAKSAERTAAREYALRTEAKDISSTVGRLARVTFQYTTSTNFVIGAEREP